MVVVLYDKSKLKGMTEIFKTSFEDVAAILLSGLIIYILVIIYIRILGKRSTSELNNFDWIVTVSIGSIVSSTIILEDISIVDGGVAVFLLLVLQYLVTKMMLNSDKLRKIVKSTPTLLFINGEFMDASLKRERVLKHEIYAAIRQHGFKGVDQIYAVVLETNSKLSVIPKNDTNEVGLSLIGVSGLPEDIKKQLDIHSQH